MKVNIVDFNRVIELNNLEEVRNPVFFNKGNIPTEDGLFSYPLFGRPGSYDRKTIFGFIDLKGKFLHPLVYKNLLRVNRKFEDCITGRKTFRIDARGEIVEAEDGETGIDFLFRNWGKIKFRETESTARSERVQMLSSLKKEDAFCDKWLVIPAFYRDVNWQDAEKGKVSHDAVNELYAKLIRMTLSLRENDSALTGLDFVGNATKTSVQLFLNDIYAYFTSKVKGKSGLFRQAVMGKSVDYAGRSVISAPHFNANRYTDMKVSFTNSGVPLAQAITVFAPFVIKWIQDRMQREFGSIKTIQVRGAFLKKKDPKKYKGLKDDELVSVNFKDPMEDYTYDEIKKKIDQFMKASTERFEIIEVNTEVGYVPYRITGGQLDQSKGAGAENVTDSTIWNRFATWTDFFYMAAVDICSDKHIYITRYPLEDYFGIYPSKVTVLSTFKTATQMVSGIVYPHYPVVDMDTPKEKIPGLFIDSLQLFNAMLPAIGGDFDGDMVTLRGVFTQEANEEADRLINSPKNILNITGKNIRKISNEGVQTLYNLTKEELPRKRN